MMVMALNQERPPPRVHRSAPRHSTGVMSAMKRQVQTERQMDVDVAPPRNDSTLREKPTMKQKR